MLLRLERVAPGVGAVGVVGVVVVAGLVGRERSGHGLVPGPLGVGGGGELLGIRRAGGDWYELLLRGDGKGVNAALGVGLEPVVRQSVIFALIVH